MNEEVSPLKRETISGLRLTPVRETSASVVLTVAERSGAAVLTYAGLLGTLTVAFGWPVVWPALVCGAAAVVFAVWCALGRGWRQWLPALLALHILAIVALHILLL